MQDASVDPTPAEPRQVTEINLTSTEPGVIHASWNAPTESPEDYRVAWAKTGENFLTWRNSDGNAFPTDAQHSITNLEEGEEYKVKVRARYDSGGPGPWSDVFTVTVASTQ